MKRVVTAKEVESDLLNLFNIGSGISIFRDGRFYLSKWEFDRTRLSAILADYFSDKMLEPGWKLVVDPVEYIYSEIYLTCN